ncbi:hypothetical protein [Hydrogenimonas sp.]
MRFLLILLVFISMGCSKKNGYKEVSVEFLKQELNYTKAPAGYSCLWRFYYKDNFYFIKYSCVPKSNKGSILYFVKKYKINKASLEENNIEINDFEKLLHSVKYGADRNSSP